MTFPTNDERPDGKRLPSRADKRTEDSPSGDARPGNPLLSPDAASNARALAETNRALQAAMEELREARDRLCQEADEFGYRAKERSAELEAIINSLPDAVYIGDEDGIFRCNQRALEMLGCDSVAELQAQIPILSAKLQNRYAGTGEPIAPEDEAFARALRGEPWTYEVISKNLKTGEDVIQRCAANPIVLDGEIVGAVAINTDITEQKRTERALRDAVGRLSEREAALLETTARLQETQDELEARVSERTGELAAREAALKASQAQLRALTHRLVQVQEAERRALARDLHDTAGQAMTVINLGLAMLRREAGGNAKGADGVASEKTRARLDELRHVADTVAEDLHRLSVNLRPSSLDRYGLVPALDDLINTMRKQAAIEVDFQVEGLEERLPDDVETALYRIVQEATTNITRYASASHASISLAQHVDRVRLHIEDNGRGFDIEEALGRGRLGLLGMQERAEMLGGTFDLESQPGQGTRLRVEAPVGIAAGADNDRATASGATALVERPNPANELRQDAPAAPGPDANAAAELARAKALSDVLVEISARLGSAENASDMLEFILARAAEAIGCEVATIMERVADGWLVSHGYNASPGLVGRRLSDLEAPTTAKAVRTREVIVVNNVEAVGPSASRAAASFALTSFACVPLVSGERVLGAANFSYHTLRREFAPSEVEFLKRLAWLVSLALENIQLRELETEQRRQLEASNGRLQNAYHELQSQADELTEVNVRLAEERDRLSVLMTNIPDEVWFADAAGNVLAANPAALRGVGLDSTGEPFQPFPDWVTLEIRNPNGQPRPLEQTPLLRALRGERVERQEEIVRNLQTGEWRYRQASGEAIRDNEGQIVGAVLVVRDISDQMATESAKKTAQEQAERLAAERQAVLDAIPDGLIIYDSEGRILYRNAVAQELLRYGQGAQSLTMSERLAEVLESGEGPDPTSRDAIPASASANSEPARGAGIVLLKGDGSPFAGDEYPAVRALRGETVRNEEVILRVPGRPASRISVSAAPVVNPGGLLSGAVTVLTDITEPVRAREEAQAQAAVAQAAREQAERLASELDTILASIADGLVVYDAEGRIVRMNAFAEQMLGYGLETRRSTLRERTARLINVRRPDGTPFTFDEYPAVRALRGEVVRNQDMVFRLNDGGVPDLRASVSSAPVRSRDGAIVGCVTTVTNTEAYHRAMEQLREANDRLSERETVLQRAVAELDGILNALPSGLIVYNAEGRIVRMNEPVKDMLGYEDEIWKRPVSERATVAVQVFRPDGTPYPREEFAALRALRGQSVHNEDTFVHLPARPDRDFWAMISACPIKGPEGDVSGAVVTLADTGEFHRVSEQLRRTNAELEAILESIPDGLIVNDVDGRVSRMNGVAEQMLRYTPEVRALSMRERLPARMRLFQPDGTPFSFEEYPPVQALAGKVTRSRELIMRMPSHPDRDIRVLASAGPIRTEQGEALGAVTILTDISDLHETRNRLQQANAVLVTQAARLRETGDQLEQRVRERTASLQQATEELGRAQGELQALSRRLVEMQEEERSYVADQLYNQAAQVLAALKMQLWSLEKNQQHEAPAAQLAEMKATLDDSIRALHDLAGQLRPAALDRLTLATMLRDHVSRHMEAQGLAFRFDAGGAEDLRLLPNVVTAVFRSVQEALANVERHASATEVALTLSHSGTMLLVTLADNGVGFDPADAHKSGGVGLIGMRERIESVGGYVKVSSAPAGTTIIIAVPQDSHP